MTAEPMQTEEELLTLNEVAERRGLHYMTVYRHVRTGRLPAIKQGGEWRVRLSDLNHKPDPSTRGKPGNANVGARLPAFRDRLLAGDEPGAWSILETCLGGGTEPAELHHQLIIPVLRSIGESWADGTLRVVDEHTASAILHRLVARLGPMMRSKGRSRGTIVIGAVAGDTHALATSIVSDLLRNARYSVIDLGGNTPTQSFIDTINGVDQCRAVGLSLSTQPDQSARKAIAVLEREFPGLPIIIGGRGIRDAEHAIELGSAGYAAESQEIVTVFGAAIAGTADPSPVND